MKARLEHLLEVIQSIEKDSQVTPENLLFHFCERVKIFSGDLVSPRKSRSVVEARYALYYLYRKMGYTYHEIASLMRRTDDSSAHHSTIIYGIRKIEKALNGQTPTSLGEIPPPEFMTS